MKLITLFLTALIFSFSGYLHAEYLEVETIKKAEVILIGFIKADSRIEISIIVKSPVELPPVCGITSKDTSTAEFAKWCRNHAKEQTILFATVDKDTLEVTPQFGTYSFWPQGHDRGHWIDREGFPSVDLIGAVIGKAREGENYMNKSFSLYKPSPESDK